ncbi:MAG: hypothetical protein K8L97_10525 [Anaerolineae bacterium]|nr:hypothetical protein [Anaerolineae bacterium]
MNRGKYPVVVVIWLIILLMMTATMSTAQDSAAGCSSSVTDCTLIITIPAGVNIRSLESDTFGQADPALPRTEIEVIGWLDATRTPLNAIAGGIWLVLATEDGELRAVKIDLVSKADGTPVTDAEAETTEQYGYDGSKFLPVREIPVPTPFPTMNPQNIVFPEMPDELTFSHPVFNSDALRYDAGDSETITVNQDQLLPLPLGELDADEYPILAELAVGDEEATYWLMADEERTPHPIYNDNTYPTTMSGIVVDIAREEGVPNGLSILLRTQTPQGNWYTLIMDIQNFVVTTPVDNTLYPTSLEDGINYYDLKAAFSTDKITTNNAAINVGDMVAFRFQNAHNFEPVGDGWSLVPREIELGYGLTGGFNAFIEAVDDGTISSEEAFLSVRISYENTFIVHAD